jgi:hypothetical protein
VRLNKHRPLAERASEKRPVFGGSWQAPVDDDVARSEANILVWMEYLPQDCIERMIIMGWDLTT